MSLAEHSGNILVNGSNFLEIGLPITYVDPGDLVAHYTMEEASGATIVDRSPFNNNATITGTPNRITGRNGNALSLNGTSQYATAPHSASLNITGQITLAAWIRPSTLATQYIIKKSVNNATNGYELSLSSGGLVFFRINQFTSGDTYRLNSVTAHPTNGTTWMHIAATYDGTSIKIYINGVLDNSSTPASPPAIVSNSLALAIGAQSDADRKFSGAMDDVRIYKAALSAAQVAAIAV